MSTLELTHKSLLRKILWSRFSGPALVALTIAYVVTIGIVRPAHYWDVIGYVASAYQADGYTGKELSKKTFADIRSSFGEADFRKYTEGHYRATVYRDPASLEQQIPFYSIRIVHVGLMRLLNPLIGNYARSANIVSVAFTGMWIAALAAFMWLSGVSLVYLPFVAAFVNPEMLSRGSSSPDGMACFFALLTLTGFYLEKKWFYVLAVILPLIRTDLAILSVLTLLACIGQILWNGKAVKSIATVGRRLPGAKRWRLLTPCVALAAVFVAYAAVNVYVGNYGLLTLFNFTFIDQFNPYPKTMPISHNILDYIFAYKYGLSEMIASALFPLYVLGIAMVIGSVVSSKTVSKYEMIFIVIPIIFSILHFVLFPEFQIRFFTFAACGIMVALLRAVGRPSALACVPEPPR